MKAEEKVKKDTKEELKKDVKKEVKLDKDTKEIKKDVKKDTKKNDDKKFGIYEIVKVVFFVVLVVISILFGMSLVKTGMLPSKYITLFVVVLLVINGLVGLLELTKKKWLNVIGFILIVLLSCGLGFGTSKINGAMSILEGFVTQNEERTTYYVLSKKGEYTDIKQLEGKIAGVLDYEYDLLKDEINKSVNIELKQYASIGDIVVGLELHEIDAVIVSSTVYDLIIEQNGSFEELIDKIGEVEVVGKPTEITSKIDVGNSFLIYLSGLDTRDTSTIAPTGLSDVNIVIAVNPDTHKVLLVHIPRDYFVQLHGRTGLKDKLTHAGLYGIGMSMNTVGDLFNIDLDTYIKVNFKAVTTLVDAIGGIDVYSDTAFNSSHIKGWYVQKGMNHMDGAKALAYSRERYAYASGDRHRGQNQNDVIQAIIKKVSKNPNYLLQYEKILTDMQPYFTTNFEMSSVQQLIKEQVDTMATWHVESYNVNGSNGQSATASWPNQVSYVMIPNQETINTAKSKISQVMRGQ